MTIPEYNLIVKVLTTPLNPQVEVVTALKAFAKGYRDGILLDLKKTIQGRGLTIVTPQENLVPKTNIRSEELNELRRQVLRA